MPCLNAANGIFGPVSIKTKAAATSVPVVTCSEAANGISAPVKKEAADWASIPNLIHDNTKDKTETTISEIIKCDKIREALQKIRFLTMTPEQFSDGPALSSLLTDKEKLSILINISSKRKNVPMPNGFSCLYTRCRDYTRPPVCINCKSKHENAFGGQKLIQKDKISGSCHDCKAWSSSLYHFPKTSAFPFVQNSSLFASPNAAGSPISSKLGQNSSSPFVNAFGW